MLTRLSLLTFSCSVRPLTTPETEKKAARKQGAKHSCRERRKRNRHVQSSMKVNRPLRCDLLTTCYRDSLFKDENTKNDQSFDYFHCQQFKVKTAKLQRNNEELFRIGGLSCASFLLHLHQQQVIQVLLSPDPPAFSSWQHFYFHQPPACPALCTSCQSPDPSSVNKNSPIISQSQGFLTHKQGPGTCHLFTFTVTFQNSFILRRIIWTRIRSRSRCYDNTTYHKEETDAHHLGRPPCVVMGQSPPLNQLLGDDITHTH